MPAGRSLRASLDVALPPAKAFEAVVSALRDGLSRVGLTLEPGPRGRVVQRGEAVGKVTSWSPSKGLSLEWRPATWKEATSVSAELRCARSPSGTRVTFELKGWDGVLADDGAELAAWFGSGLLSPLLRAISPEGLGEWLTDRTVRRPTGPRAREVYSNPTFHWPNFLLILDRISLTPDDNLLEVGCGGGAFLRKALESGCHATAIDHSPEMVRLASEQNRPAVAAGILRVLEGDAQQLPVPDDTFTCAVMTGVIGFIPDPVAALREVRRALRPGGRVAIFGATSALKGTPAAPEPFASRIQFYDKGQFEEIGRRAGFANVVVEEPDLAPYARAAGVPAEAMDLFRPGSGALLLTARKG